MMEDTQHPSFARACGALAREHPAKVMAIVGAMFFVAGIAASGLIARAPAVRTTATQAPPPSAPSTPPSEADATTVATSRCDRQTWPYLDEKCRDALAEKSKANPPIRVVVPEREAPPNVTIAANPPASIAPEPNAGASANTDASKPPAIEVNVAPVMPAPPPATTPAPTIVTTPSAAASQSAPETTASAPAPEIRDAAKPVAAVEPQATPPKPARPAVVTEQTAEPEAAQTAKAKAKRDRKQRRREDDGETVLVRDTVRYPDGREYSVVRRVKKDEQSLGEERESRRTARAEETDEDEDFDTPRRAGGLFWRMRD